jgi:hypothetical protein
VARTSYGFRIGGDQALIMPRCIYWFGVWEPPLSDWIRRALRPGDVFVDVGANIGWFTLLGARAVAPGGSVVAIEASPDTARRLDEALALNHIDNVPYGRQRPSTRGRCPSTALPGTTPRTRPCRPREGSRQARSGRPRCLRS